MSPGYHLEPKNKEAFEDQWGYINVTQRIWLKIAPTGQTCANLSINKIAATCNNTDYPHRKPHTKTTHCMLLLVQEVIEPDIMIGHT